jgi:hypothetical protein
VPRILLLDYIMGRSTECVWTPQHSNGALIEIAQAHLTWGIRWFRSAGIECSPCVFEMEALYFDARSGEVVNLPLRRYARHGIN